MGTKKLHFQPGDYVNQSAVSDSDRGNEVIFQGDVWPFGGLFPVSWVIYFPTLLFITLSSPDIH